jgi:hypothetical protein
VNAVGGQRIFIPLGFFAAVLFAFGILADDKADLKDGEKGDKKEKEAPLIKPRQSASSALSLAAKNMTKAKSYKVNVNIEGGISSREDHKVTEKTVGESYEGEVFGSMMYIPRMDSQTLSGVKAFRMPKKGVAYIQGSWRRIDSHTVTNRMHKLFTFPETILSRAIANANTAQWIITDEDKAEAKKLRDGDAGGKAKASGGDEDSGKESASADADAKADDGADKPAKKGEVAKADAKKPGKSDPKAETAKADAKKDVKAQAGKTVSRKALQAAEEEKALLVQPHLIRVDVAPKEALTNFTEVQNSGCMSAG